MASTIHGVPAAMTTEMTTATRANRGNMVPMARLISSSRRAPTYWPMSTVPPVDRPTTRAVTVCITWLPLDTPARAAEVENCPTAAMSTAP